MNIVSEVTTLLRDLASHLHGKKSEGDASEFLTNDDPSTDDDVRLHKVSLLNKSLNFNVRSPVLDAVLSMLCYEAPDVHSSKVKFLVDTLITVLMSSICCRVISQGTCPRSKNNELITEGGALLQQMTIANSVAEGCLASERQCLLKADILQIGSLISSNDCNNLIETCINIIDLDHHGEFSHLLAHAFLKVATSVSFYKAQFPSSSMIYEKFKRERVSSASRFHVSFTSGFLKERWDAQCRQLTWFLDPLSLKEDISLILRNFIKRPFLSLRMELRDKVEWRSIMIGLVSCPSMFIEVRSLLHHWLLCTGSNTILSLRTQLVSSLFDILARPTFWGIPLELGLVLPFPYSFFPAKQKQILEVLSGPVSCAHFQELNNLIEQYAYSSRLLEPMSSSSLGGSSNLSASNTMPVDDNSTWAMLLDFPVWFYFAAILLFHHNKPENDFKRSEHSQNADESAHQFSDLHVSATRYLSWILCPTDSANQDTVLESLNEASITWAKCHRVSASRLDSPAVAIHTSLGRKLKKEKGGDVRKDDGASSSKKCVMSVKSWLESFHTRLRNYQKAGFSYSTTQMTFANESTKASQPSDTHTRSYLLIHKIPVGIFIGNIATLDHNDCSLLLHYISTGHILLQEEINECDGNMNQISVTCEQVEKKFLQEKCKWKYVDWVRGSVFLFDLLDTLEDILPEIYGYECTLGLICQLKEKSSMYLCSCIRNLLQVSEGVEMEMLMDLHIRFLRWIKQGGDVFEGHAECNELAQSLNHISLSKQS